MLEYWEMDWGLTDALQQVVNDFNTQNPDIYVKMTQLSWGDYTQKFLGALAAGTPPDISGGDGGMPFNFDAQGQILPLDDLYQKWKQEGRFDDMTPWAQEKFNYNGHYVGVGWQIDARAIFYRKDWFEQAGIKPPTTHDELLAAAKQLTDTSKEQYGICVPGKQGSYDTDQFYMTLVFQNGGTLSDEQGNPTFNSPEHLQALKFEKELVDTAAPPGTASYDMGQIDQMYQQDKCAMVFEPMGYASLWRLQSQAPELYQKTGVLPVLKGQGPKATQRIVGFYNPWMIYKQSKHPEEAMKFLDFMMQKENLLKVYSISGGAHGSVYKSLQQDPLYQKEEMTKELAQQVAQYSVDYWYPNNQAAVGIATIGTGIADLIVNPVLAGAREPEDALEDAQTQLSPLFEKQAP
jgi:ABC-type glycerol-3-phosphate transport system substrate-binding protein